MRRLMKRLRADDGILFLAPLIPYLAAAATGLAIGTTGIAIGSQVNAVASAQYVMQANNNLRIQMDEVVARTEGKTDPRSKRTNALARDLREFSQRNQTEAFNDALTEVNDQNMGIGTDFGIGLVGGPLETIATVKSVGYDLPKMAYEAAFSPAIDEKTEKYIRLMNMGRFDATTRVLEAGGDMGLGPIPPTPLEGAILETKTDVVQRDIAKTTGVKYANARSLAEAAMIAIAEETKPEQMTTPMDVLVGDDGKVRDYDELVLDPEYGEAMVADDTVEEIDLTRESWNSDRTMARGRWVGPMRETVEKVDPKSAKGKSGEIVLDPEDEARLKSGDLDQAIGVFMSNMGPQPVIVTPKDDGKSFSGTFPTLKDAPAITSNSSFKLPEKAWKSWWDNSRSSCPYLYAWDGTGFSAVNDIISVSRDPKREYTDWMLFGSVPRAGELAIRIEEVRAEESFLDHVRVWAIDVADGLEAALTPEGRALSVDAGTPTPLVLPAGTAPLVATEDGLGVHAYDGSQVEAVFAVPRTGAVLLMTATGFEDDGTVPRIMPKRPGIVVEAFSDGVWKRVGEAHPREQSDTTAFDLGEHVRGGVVRVRVTSISCDTSRYHLIDRLALSGAPSDGATMREVRMTAPAQLSARDGERLHLTPGEWVELTGADSTADAYAIESVGWYRQLTR